MPILNADKTKHTLILFDGDSDFSKHPDFQKMLQAETDIHDGIFDTLLASDKSAFFRIDDWSQCPSMPRGSREVVSFSMQI